MKHQLKEVDDSKMHLDEIWRLEQTKDALMGCVVQLLKTKMKMWENLSTGETTSLDRFIVDVLAISKQLEESRSKVEILMQDFNSTVRK